MELHIKNIKPLFTNILTTADRFVEDEVTGAIITNKENVIGRIKYYQTVVAVGPMVRDIHIGDKVVLNFKAYAVKKYDPNSVKEDMGMNCTTGYLMPIVEVYDENNKPQERLFLNDRDIEYIYEGEEVEEPKSTFIMPKEKKIIIG